MIADADEDMRNDGHTSKGTMKVRKLWLGIGILALLAPLGLMLPKWLGAEGAWGEWGPREIEKLVGYVPEGMKRLAERWKAPLPDYGVPGQGKGIVGEGAGYVLTGIIGIALTAGVMYALAKLLGKRDGTDDPDKK